MGPNARYVTHWVESVGVAIGGGEMAVMTHDDGMRTIHVESDDDEGRKHVSRVCDALGGRWVQPPRLWVMRPAQAETAIRVLMQPQQAGDTFFIMLLMGWLMMAISFTPFGEMGYNGKESSEMLRMVFWGWLTAGIILGALHHAWRASRDDLIQTPDQDQDTHL